MFNNLNANSPISAGATLGIDATGRVVTVTGSSFAPAYGQISLPASVVVAPTGGGSSNNAVPTDLLQITLPVAGTYLIIYSVRAQQQTFITAGQNSFATAFIKDGTGTQIPGSAVIISGLSVADGTSGGMLIGTNCSGTLVRVVTNPSGETLTLSVYTGNTGTPSFRFINDANGTTQMSFVKITP